MKNLPNQSIHFIQPISSLDFFSFLLSFFYVFNIRIGFMFSAPVNCVACRLHRQSRARDIELVPPKKSDPTPHFSIGEWKTIRFYQLCTWKGGDDDEKRIMDGPTAVVVWGWALSLLCILSLQQSILAMTFAKVLSTQIFRWKYYYRMVFVFHTPDAS